LKAIAALLGKSMRMTMVYAKIANRTVADEYFAGRQKIFDACCTVSTPKHHDALRRPATGQRDFIWGWRDEMRP
jgi:hypothetical protein